MSVASNIPAPGVPVVGPDGRMSSVWFQFFMTLLRRTGDTQGVTTDDQSIVPSGDSGLAETIAQLFSLRDAMHMVPPVAPMIPPDDQTPPPAAAASLEDPHARIEALEATVQRLATEIEAIRQGQQL